MKPRLATRKCSRVHENADKKVPLRIKLPELTFEEVEAAKVQSKSDKAPGLDDTKFHVWKELWPVLGKTIVALSQASLDQKHVPQRWRRAKIVVLRKSNKPDCSNPKAYRPISLPQTISKEFEAFIARRSSYLPETYRPLLGNHFGGQALKFLVERIHKAWRGGRVLSLVSFDVRGALNEVHPTALAARLGGQWIPSGLVAWTESFCRDRRASAVVGAYESPVQEVQHARITKGAPLQ